MRTQLPLRDEITIATLNVGGLRRSYKKESLRAVAHDLKFTVGVITETHLLKHEADKATFPGYQVLNKLGRATAEVEFSSWST